MAKKTGLPRMHLDRRWYVVLLRDRPFEPSGVDVLCQDDQLGNWKEVEDLVMVDHPLGDPWPREPRRERCQDHIDLKQIREQATGEPAFGSLATASANSVK